MSRGSANAALMAGSVISENVTRFCLARGMPAASATCHAMASPSRSRSVARNTVSARPAALLMLATSRLRDPR